MAIASSTVLAQADSLKPSAWVPLPAIGSSPETGFQYGAYVMRIFPQTDVDIPQNRLELLLQGTTKGQFQAYLWPDFYVSSGDWKVKGKLGGKYWPNEYFGEGNETPTLGDKYADTAVESSITASLNVSDNISIGSSFFAELHDIENIADDTNSTLLDSNVSGHDGGLYTGVGLSASYDTRDNIDWPTHGQLVSANLDIFTEVLASSLSFQVAEIRGSQYIPLGSGVIAFSGHTTLASSDTPFTHLPRPTGDRTLRGANGNRWIDQRSLGLQSEYRKTISNRWAVVGFLDTVQVASDYGSFTLSDFHYSTGLGVRYGMTPDRFNIRLDVGWVDADAISFAITVGEAF